MFGKLLIVIGVLLFLLGLVFVAMPKVPFLGNLPGDIVFKRGNLTFYFPLATCIIISIVVSIILTLILKK
jgi:hypothetical protein